MNRLKHIVAPKHRWTTGILSLALVAALTLSIALAAFPAVASAKNPGPNAILSDKGKTKTPEPSETPEPTKTPKATKTPEPSETPRSTATPGGPARTRFEIKGRVEARPQERIGTWRIAGQNIVVDETTRFIEKKGPAVVGAIVEAKGFRQPDGRLVASRIKVEDGPASPISTPSPAQGL